MWTWRVSISPDEIQKKLSDSSLDMSHFKPIVNHSLKFLSYEGPVQKGTGQVKIADKGVYTLINQQENILIIELHGKVVSGRLEIHIR